MLASQSYQTPGKTAENMNMCNGRLFSLSVNRFCTCGFMYILSCCYSLPVYTDKRRRDKTGLLPVQINCAVVFATRMVQSFFY